MLFENYPRAKQIVDDLNYHEHVAKTSWLQMSKDEAAINLAKVLITKKALTSTSIPMKMVGKLQVDQDYKAIGSSIHVFAKEEGRSQVNISNEGVTQLFAHIEIGGSRYTQKTLK